MMNGRTLVEHDQPAARKRRRPIARGILAVLLLAMAAGQLLDFGGFVATIETYRVGSTAISAVLGLALVVGETVAGVLLLSRPRRRFVAALVALGIAIIWSLLAAQAFLRGLHVPNCGCFGVYFSQELRWWILLEDVEFVALAAVVLRRETAALPPTTAGARVT